MPIFHISVVNHRFTSRNEQDLAKLADAKEEAIKGALQIGIQEVSEEQPFFGAEVTVGDSSGCLARFVVAIGVSPIQ